MFFFLWTILAGEVTGVTAIFVERQTYLGNREVYGKESTNDGALDAGRPAGNFLRTYFSNVFPRVRVIQALTVSTSSKSFSYFFNRATNRVHYQYFDSQKREKNKSKTRHGRKNKNDRNED
ncbi:hypothetical protein B5X24_HaOG208907 [Helicoverpa armigera]|nr:hypothetical protein B5X24_HaOG208907 [Helicoverpa armigera]